MIKNKEWQEAVDAPNGSVFKDWVEAGVRCLIIRGPISLCAYVGIPKNHPLTAYGYDNVPLREYYAQTHEDLSESSGYYWHGWQCTDNARKAWTEKMVEDEIKEAAVDWQNFSILLANKLKDNEIITLKT